MTHKKVNWESLTAEEVLEALETRPVVLDPWRAWDFSKGWSRDERYPWREGAKHHVSALTSTTGGWSVFGFTPCGTSLPAKDEAEALALADQLARDRGWKLLGISPSLIDKESEIQPAVERPLTGRELAEKYGWKPHGRTVTVGGISPNWQEPDNHAVSLDGSACVERAASKTTLPTSARRLFEAAKRARFSLMLDEKEREHNEPLMVELAEALTEFTLEIES